MFGILALLFLLLLVGLPIAVVMAFKRIARLETRVNVLEGLLAGVPDTPAAEAPPSEPTGDEPEPPKPSIADFDANFEPDEPEPQFPQTEPQPGDFTAAAAAPAPARRASFEEALGTKWTVWLGGLALALGAVFLVRFTIENDLLGPGIRILLGGLLAVGLLAAGEFARRRELASPIPGLDAAHIPGVLSAVGTLAGFATIYAAYALYGFLDPLVAFILLGVVSLASLAGALLHGPALAALGLVGSYVTPALVATDHPNIWMLFIYLLFVTGSAFALADARRWMWLAVCAAAGAVTWALMWLAGPWTPGDNPAFGLYMAALFALTLFFLRDDSTGDDTDAADGPDWVAGSILAAVGFLALPILRLNDYDGFSLGLLAATMAASIGAAWRWPRLTTLAAWVAGLFTFAFVSWHIPTLMDRAAFEHFIDFARSGPEDLRHFLTIGAAFAGALLACGAAASLTGRHHGAWAGVAVVAPLVTFIYAYFRAARFEQSPPFAIAALVLAALLAVVTELVLARSRGDVDGDDAADNPVAIYAAGAVGWLALGLTIELEKGWLTLALALLTPGLAWISLKRPYWVFRPLALGLAGIVTARLILDPFFAGHDAGATPVFNWLLYGYGVPAAAFAAAAWAFRQRRTDLTVQVLEGAAIAYTVVLASLQIRHLMNNGNVASTALDLAELSIHSLTWLGLSIGLNRLYRRGGRLVAGYGSEILGVAGLAAIAFGHLLIFNPALTGDYIGQGVVLNDLLLGFAAPAVMCLALAWTLKTTPSRSGAVLFGRAARVLALVLAFAYVSLQVMAFYQGPWLSPSATMDAELYTYSAVWLLFGVALLAGGIVLASAALRYGSFAVVMLTVLKVFLVDMSALTGALRAVSFLALGLVLIGIGTVYQKLVFPRHNDGAAPSGPPDDGAEETEPPVR